MFRSCAQAARTESKSLLPRSLSSDSMRTIESELSFVEIEMSDGISVQLTNGHVIGEERVPAHREEHSPSQRLLRFALQSAAQRTDDPVGFRAHPVPVKHQGCSA